MHLVINNLLHSKAPLMVVLRYVLVLLVILMGIERLRIILELLTNPKSYLDRDLLTYYLMSKAFLANLNPYLPLNELALRFVGSPSDLTHPAPCTPIMILLFVPLALLSLGNSIVVWFVIEILLLVAIAYMLTILWSEKPNVLGAILIFFFMLAWYPIMVDLLYGQLTILLTALVLAAFLALRKDQKILAGILIGFSMAIKMYTWPLIVYFAVKKDWRTFMANCLTFVGLNLIALFLIGVGPITDYYLRVAMQVSSFYHSFLQNYSVWSIGYRLFEGTKPIGGDFISAPPLVSLPGFSLIVSAGLAVSFLIIGLIWAKRSKDLDIAYSIIICVLIAISPISWDHYYLMAIIPMAVLLHVLSRQSFPTWPTLIFIIIAFMLFFFNDHIADIIFILNGKEFLQATGNRITFSSSLLEILPMIELVTLSVLLWRIDVQQTKAAINSGLHDTSS